MDIVCFHNPDEENGFLSNWYLSDFVINNVKFSSMEQYMMYSKAMCFKDKEIAEQILQTSDVSTIKKLGRKVKNYNNVVWNGLRQIIVYEGLKAKFEQNEELKKLLTATGDSVLAECAVRDKIWGIGKSMTSRNRLDMSTWEGENLLGFALMAVRSQLK